MRIANRGSQMYNISYCEVFHLDEVPQERQIINRMLQYTVTSLFSPKSYRDFLFIHIIIRKLKHTVNKALSLCEILLYFINFPFHNENQESE
jgi:hypothetical protein